MASFDLAIPTVLANEGGYINNPKDPGGETNFGISKRRYPFEDIKNLTVARATYLYQRDFWIFTGIVSQQVATKIFDAYVNMEHAAVRIMQTVVGAIPDGFYGSATEALINKQGDDLLDRYRAGLVTHYEAIAAANPAEAVFLNGWLRRARQ
jgi:lysozyme family protein